MANTKNAFEFAISLEKLGEDMVDEALTNLVKKISMTALSMVVMRSPVDTGRFRETGTFPLAHLTSRHKKNITTRAVALRSLRVTA